MNSDPIKEPIRTVYIPTIKTSINVAKNRSTVVATPYAIEML